MNKIWKHSTYFICTWVRHTYRYRWCAYIYAERCTHMYIAWVRHTHQRRQWHPTPVLLPGKSHGWRSLVGCSPWGRKESDTTERLHFQFSLLCIGEGNCNQLQCFCLENPRDRGAWLAAVYGVAQSWTRLKRLSSSSSSSRNVSSLRLSQDTPSKSVPLFSALLITLIL